MPRLIVVGSGIAGLFAALAAHRCGVRDVVLVTKAALEDGATRYAQGGIAAAVGVEDSWELHAADTMSAGVELCDHEAVRVLTREAAQRVADLIFLGVRFDREHGRLAYAREAAHGVARVLHAGGDATGRHIEEVLAATVLALDVEVRDAAFVDDLIVEAGACRGVRLLGGEELEADAVVLAAGGAGQLYASTTNPSVATGDGVALALRAGAIVADLEFFQFHPTAFAGPEGWRFLVSEAVRGHGAVLRNHRGEAFMAQYDARAELAPRDVVARAIVREMARHELANVWLDATGFPHGEFARRFPSIDAHCRRQGCDPERALIPVSPAAHYMMGGVWTDVWGRTSIPRLYACGETAATGVHGANRLASNSLLEGLVFGWRVAEAVAGASAVGAVRCPESEPLTLGRDSRPVPADRASIRTRMWQDVGILRDEAGLERACGALARWAPVPPSDEVKARETANLALVGWAMAEAAWRRQESRGAHHRLDFPTLREVWRRRQFFVLPSCAPSTAVGRAARSGRLVAS
jgi:L-aspartate oxidase